MNNSARYLFSGGTALSYDVNGNLLSYGLSAYSFDYRNRLATSSTGTATTTYGYDYLNQRVRKATAAAATAYPNQYYSATGADITRTIYAGGELVATVDTASGGGGGASTSTPAYVQSKDHNDGGPVVLNSSVTSGNLIVVGLTAYDSTIPSNAITDNKGNTYAKAVEVQNGTDRAAIFYAKNVTGGSSFTVSSSVYGTISVHEYSGVNQTAPLDQTNTKTGTSATVLSNNVTTTLGNELYFGLAWSSGNNHTWTAGNGYTKREEEVNNNDHERQATEDQVIANATTTQARFTTSGSGSYAAAIATFKPLVSGGGGGATTTTLNFVHGDHLGSTNVVTDEDSDVVQTLDYYPYGAARIDDGTDVSKREYIGIERDEESGLDYALNRYYTNERGQFISQDPVFWEVGQTEDGIKALFNPQTQNSYSYAANNPIVNKDPEGRYLETAFDVAMFTWSLNDFRESPNVWNAVAVAADGLSLLVPIPAIVGGLKHGDDAYRESRVVQNIAQASNWSNPVSLMDHTIRHAGDFGLKANNYKGYAKAASSFYKNTKTTERFTDSKGVTRVYDSKTNTFGSYDKSGKTKTFFKPDRGVDYWKDQQKKHGKKD